MRYDYDNAEAFAMPDELLSELERSIGRPFESAALLAELSKHASVWGSHGFSLELEGDIHLSVSLYWYNNNQYQIIFKIGSSAAGFGAEGRDLFRVTGEREAINRLWENVVTPKKKALTRYQLAHGSLNA